MSFALARDCAIPMSNSLKKVSAKHKIPRNAIYVGTIVPFASLLRVLVNPSKPVHIVWFFYSANVNALNALVSFATSGV